MIYAFEIIHLNEINQIQKHNNISMNEHIFSISLFWLLKWQSVYVYSLLESEIKVIIINYNTTLIKL